MLQGRRATSRETRWPNRGAIDKTGCKGGEEGNALRACHVPALLCAVSHAIHFALSPGVQINIPMLQIRKLNLIATGRPAQDLTPSKWRRDLNPSPSDTQVPTLHNSQGSWSKILSWGRNGRGRGGMVSSFLHSAFSSPMGEGVARVGDTPLGPQKGLRRDGARGQQLKGRSQPP